MANRYVRSTGGNYNAAGTWESASGLKDVVAVPTSSDDVFLDGQSGQLTINVNSAAKTFNCQDGTGGVYTGTLTISTGIGFTVSGNAKFASGMTIIGETTAILGINSTATLTSAGKVWPCSLTLTGTTPTFTLADNWTVLGPLSLATTIVLDGSILYLYNNLGMTGGPVTGTTSIVLKGHGTWSASSSTYTLANNLTIDSIITTISGTVYYKTGILTHTSGRLVSTSSTLDLRGACTLNLTKDFWNQVTFTTAGTYDVQGLWCTGTIAIAAACTWTNFNILGAPPILITTATTQTVSAATFSIRGCNIWATADHATISCTGAIKTYLNSVKNIDFSGGGTFNVYGGTNVSGNSGVTFNALPYTRPTTLYLDPVNGDDSIVTPWGFWSAPFTGGEVQSPAVDETMTGITSSSTAKIAFVETTSGSWAGNNAAGILYFYGKSNPFTPGETIVESVSGGHCEITTDLAYSCLKTINGATAIKVSPGNTIRIAKSPDPVAISGGNCTWGGVAQAGGGDISFSSISHTSATPIVVTKAAHGLSTGDRVVIYSATVNNLQVNGTWIVTWLSSSTFSLDNSVGSGGANGTNGYCQRINYKTVVLPNDKTKVIDNCNYPSWTAANAATATLQDVSISAKEGGSCQKIVKAAPVCPDTLYAYKTITTADYSGYQKISFWFQNAVTNLAGNWVIKLCSDTAGVTAVDTFEIPYAFALGWIPIVLSRVGGGNLGSSIQSVALYSGVSPKASTGVLLDNIQACTTAGINLTSLITKDSVGKDGVDGCYPIQSIVGKIVSLDNIQSTPSTGGRGYNGVLGSFATYIRETIKTIQSPTNTAYVQEVQQSGTAGNLISYEGGYDTALNVQNGETYFDGLSNFGYGIIASAKSFISINYLNTVRYYSGAAVVSADSITIPNMTCISNDASGFSTSALTNVSISNLFLRNNGTAASIATTPSIAISNLITDNGNAAGFSVTSGMIIGTIRACNNVGVGLSTVGGTITTVSKASYNTTIGVSILAGNLSSIENITDASYNSGAGLDFATSANRNYIGTITSVNYNSSHGISFGNSSESNFIKSAICTNNTGYGVIFPTTSANNNRINFLTTSGNTTAAVYMPRGCNYLRNALLGEGSKITGATVGCDCRLYVWKYTQTPNVHYVYTDGGTIESTAAAGKRHTASGIAWRIAPSATRTIYYPIVEKLAEIAVNANKLVTVTCWIKKDHITNIGASIVCRGNQLAGVPDNLEQIATSVDTNYNQVTMTFTPTEAGVITIDMKAWYTSTAISYAYFDDLSVIQAS